MTNSLQCQFEVSLHCVAARRELPHWKMSLVRKNGSDLVSGQERQEGMRVEQGIEK